MFLQIFKYTFKRCTRSKIELFWTLLFPIALGLLFYVSFSGIYEKDELFKAVPVAVINKDQPADELFLSILDGVSKKDDNQLFTISFTDSKKANEWLKENEVVGIIDASNLELTMSQDNKDQKIQQSIINSFLQQYKQESTAIKDIIQNNPAQMQTVLNSLKEKTDFNHSISYSDGNMDVYIQYFYNLIAMMCLYACFFGVKFAISSQANLSKTGARIRVAPTHRLLTMAGELSAVIVFEFIVSVVIVLFYRYGLSIDLSGKLPMLFTACFFADCVGVTLGYFIGSIGHIGEGVKIAIVLSVTMICCFASGLMVGGMHGLIELYCPIINQLNPASIISDCFYSLNVFDTYTRFTKDILSLAGYSVAFTLGAYFFTRRDTYASL